MKDTLFETPVFHRLIRREHFHSLRLTIHFFNVIQYDPENSSKKLKYFIKKLLEKFKNNYTPKENIAIEGYHSL